MVFIVRFVRYDDTGVFPRIIKLYRHACYAEISSQFYKSELFVRSVLDFKYIKFLSFFDELFMDPNVCE